MDEQVEVPQAALEAARSMGGLTRLRGRKAEGSDATQPESTAKRPVVLNQCPVCAGGENYLKRGRVSPRPVDREFMKMIHNTAQGESVFVLGGGPSLRLHDRTLIAGLSGRKTIAMNFLSKWNGLSFRPTYWAVSEEDWIQQIDESLRQWEAGQGIKPGSSTRVFAKNRFPALLNEPQYETWSRVHVEGSMFIRDGYLGGVNQYWISGFPHFAFSGVSVAVDNAIQLALWLGADVVYLMGVDARDAQMHAYDDDVRRDAMNRRQTTGEVSGTNKWQGLIEAVQQVHDSAAKKGRRIVNLSPDSALTIPRARLEDVLES